MSRSLIPKEKAGSGGRMIRAVIFGKEMRKGD